MKWLIELFQRQDDQVQVWVVLIVVILIGVLALLAVPLASR